MRQEHIFNHYEVFNLIKEFDPLKSLQENVSAHRQEQREQVVNMIKKYRIDAICDADFIAYLQLSGFDVRGKTLQQVGQLIRSEFM